MKKEAPLPFKAAGTDLGVVKIYSWERGPSPASLHAWIQNLYDVDSLSLWTLYVWHGPLYKDTNLKMERVAYFEHRKGLLKQYCLEICSHNFPESNEKPRNTYFRVKQCSGCYKTISSFSRPKFLFSCLGNKNLLHKEHYRFSLTKNVPKHFKKLFCIWINGKRQQLCLSMSCISFFFLLGHLLLQHL